MNVLVTAATKNGATGEIAQAMADTLEERAINATVVAPELVDGLDDYDAVVLGSAVYTGHWLEPAKSLARRHSGELRRRPVWLFSSGPVGDSSRRLVQKMGADPVDLPEMLELTHARGHQVFAGRLEPQHVNLAQRFALAAFKVNGDFRDWTQIRGWASQIAEELQDSPVGTRID